MTKYASRMQNQKRNTIRIPSDNSIFYDKDYWNIMGWGWGWEYKLIMHVGSLLIFARHAFMQSQFPFLLCPTPSNSTSRIFDLERFWIK